VNNGLPRLVVFRRGLIAPVKSETSRFFETHHGVGRAAAIGAMANHAGVLKDIFPVLRLIFGFSCAASRKGAAESPDAIPINLLSAAPHLAHIVQQARSHVRNVLYSGSEGILIAFEGARNPLTLRTNCSDAASISSGVATSSGRRRTFILRHINL